MVNQNIVNYLSEGTKRGFSINLLKSKLLEAGFKEQDVNEAIGYLQQLKSVAEQVTQKENLATKIEKSEKKPEEKLGIFKKIGMSLGKPKELFEKTKGDSFGSTLKYFFVISIFPFVIYSVIFSLLIATIFSFLGTFLSAIGVDEAIIVNLQTVNLFSIGIAVAFTAFIFFVLSPIMLFLGAGIFHLFVKLVRGSGTYSDTFRVLTYSSTPAYIFFFLLGISQIWATIIYIIGISITHEISKLRAFLAMILPTLLGIFVFVIIQVLFYFTSQ